MIPFSRSQDSIESGSGTNIPESQPDSGSLKFDANLRRQIFALKLDTVSLSQPVLKSRDLHENSEVRNLPNSSLCKPNNSSSKMQKLTIATHLTSGPKTETTMIVQKKTSLPVL